MLSPFLTSIPGFRSLPPVTDLVVIGLGPQVPLLFVCAPLPLVVLVPGFSMPLAPPFFSCNPCPRTAFPLCGLCTPSSHPILFSHLAPDLNHKQFADSSFA